MQIGVQFGHQTKPAGLRFQNLHKGLVLLDPDRANGILGDPAGFADLGQEPARFRPARMTHRQTEPKRGSKLSPLPRRYGGGRRQCIRQHFRGRPALAPQTDKGGGHLFGAVTTQQGHSHASLFAGRLSQEGVIHHAGILARLNLIGPRRLAPFRRDLGPGQQALRLLGLGRRHNQRRHTLAPGPARPARTVQQGFRV